MVRGKGSTCSFEVLRRLEKCGVGGLLEQKCWGKGGMLQVFERFGDGVPGDDSARI